jgi:large subunit ribosomal protein L13e
LALNVARLKAYKERLVVFPKKGSKAKQDELADTKLAFSSNKVVGFTPVAEAFSEIKKSDMPKAVEGGAYRKLRESRSAARYQGAREKRAKDAAEAEANKK